MNRLKIPQEYNQPPPPHFSSNPKHRHTHLGTILLAEDDDDLRYVMQCTLISIGCRVIACPDGHIAADTFRAQSQIDLLMTDFEMPGKTGLELASELTELRPELPVILVTGSILSPKHLDLIQDKHWTYVRKPCDIASLSTKIKQLLITPDARHLQGYVA